MPIAIACEVCNAEYTLRDEYAGKRLKCKACQSVMTVPESTALVDLEPTGSRHADRYGHGGDLFDRDKFLINQKKFSINERYYIVDEDKSPIMFAERPIKFLQTIGAFLAMIFFVIVSIIVLAVLGSLSNSAGAPEAVTGVVVTIGGVAMIVLAILIVISLSPKRHVTFYTDEEKTQPLLKVLQDRKFFAITATYTVVTPQGELLGRFKKNYLYNIIRKKWWILAPDGSTLFWAKEDSLILSLLRRFLGPFFGLLRTNFIIVEPETERILGELNRKFTLFDRYVLDMTADRGHKVDRRLAVGLGIMLDTGERR